jgi:hypothetical protein
MPLLEKTKSKRELISFDQVVELGLNANAKRMIAIKYVIR